MLTGTNNHKSVVFTLILLCAGYFIDFYDLTIFSASYNNVIRDLFHITDPTKIQELYLTITNYYTIGIILGAITFGILGDKFGRAYIIRYSILIYSLAILLSIGVHSILIFTILRFVAGFGLATEFATSSVLLAELLSSKQAANATRWLYFAGILGGMTAVFIGSQLSWRTMFFFGGLAGTVLYLFRKKMLESTMFLLLTSQKLCLSRKMFKFNDLLKFIKLFLLIVPFYFTISVMFILPSFMPISFGLTKSIHLLLVGFFLGNLVSTFFSSHIINHFRDYRKYIWINIAVFLLTLPFFVFITNNLFLAYSCILGLLGGGLPTVWIQIINKAYPTQIRNTMSNTLYATGRASSILFNVLLMTWIQHKTTFCSHIIWSVIIITTLVIIVLLTSTNSYTQELHNPRKCS